MTPQEALKTLRDWYKKDKTGDVDSAACVVAFEALEKQIPKKPDYEGDGYDDNGNIDYDTWICPCCEHRFEVYYEEYDYCPDCGQALDWEDEE